MGLTQLARGVYRLPLGGVNAYLIEGDDLTLIDTGLPGSLPKIETGVRELGHELAEIDQILVTHLHADHSGSLSKVKASSGAPVYMHPTDGRMVEAGKSIRPTVPSPGVLPWIMVTLLARFVTRVSIEPAVVDFPLEPGGGLPFVDDLQVIHAPGHSAGQVVFHLGRSGGVLIAADTASNMITLGYPPIMEERELALDTLARLADLDFQVACFGHGRPILADAGPRFRRKWGVG